MWTDFHCHCLPGLDDGAADVNIASKILLKLAKQNVSTVVATPHFCFEMEDINDFLKERERALDELCECPEYGKFPEIKLGAEVVLEHGLADRDLLPLCIEGTNLLLLEFQYGSNKGWMLEEIANIAYKFSIIPVLAHFERYMAWFTKEDYKEYFDFDDLIIQINIGSLREYSCRKFFKKVNKYHKTVIFGSDSHNITTRCPSFNVAAEKEKLIRKCGAGVIQNIGKFNCSNGGKHLLIDSL